MSLILWPEKDPLEKVWLTYNFNEALDPGETITATQILVSVKAGIDANPGDILDGAVVVVANARVMQRVRNGLDSTAYLIKCKATLTSGRILLLAAVLPVKAIA